MRSIQTRAMESTGCIMYDGKQVLRHSEAALQSLTIQRESIAGLISRLTVSSMVRAGGRGDPLRFSGAELQQPLWACLLTGWLRGN